MGGQKVTRIGETVLKKRKRIKRSLMDEDELAQRPRLGGVASE